MKIFDREDYFKRFFLIKNEIKEDRADEGISLLLEMVCFFKNFFSINVSKTGE